MTLIVFAVPVIPLFPLKLVGLWLLAHEYWVSAVSVIVIGKFVGVGVTAFIFDVTRTKLLQMGWFKNVYEFIVAMRARAAALVQPIKLRIQEILRGDGDRLVIAHAAADRALPQKRARGAVGPRSWARRVGKGAKRRAHHRSSSEP